MAGRLGFRLLSGAVALSSMAGCYSHHTADEEVEDVLPWDAVPSDAGAAVSDAQAVAADAASARDGGVLPALNCQNPGDAITQAICRAQGMSPSDAGSGGQPNFQDILEGILGGGGGGLPTIPGLPTTGRDAGTGGTGTPGGGGLNCANPTDQISRILCGAMSGTGGTGQTRRDAGTPPAGGAGQFADLLEVLRELDCDNPPEGIAGFLCFLGGFVNRDGGTPTFPGLPTGGGRPGAGGGNQGNGRGN